MVTMPFQYWSSCQRNLFQFTYHAIALAYENCLLFDKIVEQSDFEWVFDDRKDGIE